MRLTERAIAEELLLGLEHGALVLVGAGQVGSERRRVGAVHVGSRQHALRACAQVSFCSQ